MANEDVAGSEDKKVIGIHGSWNQLSGIENLCLVVCDVLLSEFSLVEMQQCVVTLPTHLTTSSCETFSRHVPLT